MKEKINTIAQFIKQNANAEDYEVIIIYNDTQNTRFAQNSITQHITGNYIEVYYLCVKDKRVGRASTRQVDEVNLLDTIRKAETIAESNSPDPDNATSMNKEDYPKVQNFYQSIEKLNTEKMVEIAKKCIQNAENKDAVLSGIVSKSIIDFLFVTKNGFEGYDKSSIAELSMTLRKDKIETKVSNSHKDFDRLDVDGILSQLNGQFDSLGEVHDMDYETIPVILRQQAVIQLFSYFNYFLLDRKAADDGLTPFTGMMNQKCFGERFSFSSSSDDHDLYIQPFHKNNVHRTIEWVKNGVIKNMPTTRSWAQKNELLPSNIFNFVFEGEGVSEKEMMKMVKRGLIINNLWYIRMNDMKTADMTGMTRDGVLYFEDGEVKYAVNNFRFNEGIVEITKRILATGVSTHQSAGVKVPTMLIDNFTFVDKTTF